MQTSKRTIAFVGGLLVGALLRATLMQPEPVQPASAAVASAHCAAHPVKMPCLFDSEGH
jgi:hypothetical protein